MLLRLNKGIFTILAYMFHEQSILCFLYNFSISNSSSIRVLLEIHLRSEIKSQKSEIKCIVPFFGLNN